MIFTADLGLPEGPVLLPDGSWLVTELDLSRGTVTWVSADGSSKRPIAKTGRPNGLAVDRSGVVWVAESLDPALLSLEMSGEFSSALTECEGVPLLWPNDLAFGPDGAIYLTDSGVLVDDFLDGGRPRDDWATIPLRGRVLRFDPRSGEAWFLDDGYQFTNGIAFGPDGLLYVNETMTGNVYRYRLRDGQVDGGRELFGNVLDPGYTEPGLRGPDGAIYLTDSGVFVGDFLDDGGRATTGRRSRSGAVSSATIPARTRRGSSTTATSSRTGSPSGRTASST